MYTTIIHPIRKALLLSVDEYCILDLIYGLSHNERYGGWCVASKQYLAETLDISESKVYRTISKLLEMELITRDKTTKYLRSADKYNEMKANQNDWLVAFNGKETQFISAKAAKDLNCQLQSDSDTVKMTVEDCQNDSRDTVKMTDNNNIYNNNIKTHHFVPEKLLFTIHGHEVTFKCSQVSWQKFTQEYSADTLEDTAFIAAEWCAANPKRCKDMVLTANRLRNFLKDKPKRPKPTTVDDIVKSNNPKQNG